jgi:hypothetical protein
LLNAFAQLKTTGFDIQLSSPGSTAINGSGSIDPQKKSSAVEFTGSIQGTNVQISAVQIGTDAYFKLDLGPLNKTAGIPTQWMKIDTTKFKKSLFDTGPGAAFDVSKLAGAVSDVKQTDANHISGTIDPSKAGGMLGGSTGATAAPATFVATLDEQGRLTELQITEQGGQSAVVDIKITNYGSPTPVTAPTSWVPAPDAIYQFLNQ